jgi:hypothetical protein
MVEKNDGKCHFSGKIWRESEKTKKEREKPKKKKKNEKRTCVRVWGVKGWDPKWFVGCDILQEDL